MFLFEVDWQERAAQWDGERWLRIKRSLIGAHDTTIRFATFSASDGYEILNRLGTASAANLATMRETLDNGHETTSVQWVGTASVAWEIGDVVYETTTGSTFYICEVAHTTDATNHQPSSGSINWLEHTRAEAVSRTSYKGVYPDRPTALASGNITASGDWIVITQGGIAYPIRRLISPDGWTQKSLGSVSLHTNLFDTNEEAYSDVRSFNTSAPEYYVVDGRLKLLIFYDPPDSGNEAFTAEPPDELFANVLLELALGTPNADKVGQVRWYRGQLYECVPRWGTRQTVTWDAIADEADVGDLWGITADEYRWRSVHASLGDVSSPGDDDVAAVYRGGFARYEGLINPVGWRNLRHPDNWVGVFDTEDEADHHTTKIDDTAIIDRTLRKVTAFTAGSDAYFLWKAVSSALSGTTDVTDDDLDVGTPANESTTSGASRQSIAEAIAANVGGGGVAADNSEVLFDNYADATSALNITPGGAIPDWTAARSLTIDLSRALAVDDDAGELRIDIYGLTVFEAGSQPVNQTRRAWWNVNAGHFRTAAVNTLTTGDDAVDGWTTAVMRADNQGDNDLPDNHTRMMILSRGRLANGNDSLRITWAGSGETDGVPMTDIRVRVLFTQQVGFKDRRVYT